MTPPSIAEGSEGHPNARLRSNVGALSESAVQYGLMAYVFLLPFAKLSHVLEYAFLGLVVAWAVVKVSRREFALHFTALGLPIVLFLGWVLFTTPFAVDPAYSFSEWRKSATRVLLFFFVASAVNGERQVRNILITSVLGCVVQAIGALHMSIANDAPWHSIHYREGGWTSSSQWLATYLVMMLPFVYLAFQTEGRCLVRWGYVVGAAIVLVGLFLSHTRAAWVALAVQLLVLGALRLRRNGVLATAAAAIAVALIILATALPGPIRGLLMQERFTNTASMLMRFNTWELAIDQITVHPITGLGYGRHSFQHVVPEDPPDPLHSHVHSAVLGSAVQLGLPGFALLVWIFWRLIGDCFRTWKAHEGSFEGHLALALLLSAVGVIVRNLFDDMFVGTIVYLFWLVVGVHFSLRKRRTEPGDPVGPTKRSA